MSYAQAASVSAQNIQEQTRVQGEIGSKRIETKTKVHDVIQEFNKKREEGAGLISKWKSGLGLLAMGVGMATGLGPIALGLAAATGTGVGGLIGKNQARQNFKGLDYFGQSSDDFLKASDADLYKDMATSAASGYMAGGGIAKAGAKEGAKIGWSQGGTGMSGVKAGLGGLTGTSAKGGSTLKQVLMGGKSISELFPWAKEDEEDITYNDAESDIEVV